MNRRAPLLWLALAAALAGCRGADADAPPARAPAVEPALIDALSLLAVGDTPTAEQHRQWANRSLPQLVEELLVDPRFAEKVAPRMLLHDLFIRSSAAAMVMATPLFFEADGRRIYYLRRSCDPATAVEVAPWWAPTTKVWICEDSYRPDVLADERGWRCSGSNVAMYSTTCGCGPNLIFCNAGPQSRNKLAQSLRDEVTSTVAHVVAADAPIETIYTSNTTHRDGWADFYYQRGRLLAGEIDALPDPQKVPAEGAWLPRPESWPGQHAGILTTYHYLHISDAGRDRLRDTFSEMFCVETASVNVSTDDIRKLGVTDLREGDGWKQLAAMPICTDCHARLDHGMQFFKGFPSTYQATHAEPRDHLPGTGPLYVDDIDDHRGDAPLTPQGFSTLAVAQPEFDACIVTNVARHIFSAEAANADREAMGAALARRRSLRDVMRVALLRFADRWQHRGAPVPAPAAAPSVAAALPAAATVPVPASAKASLEEHCGDCHGADDELTLVGDALPRATAIRILDELASRRMPRFPAAMDPGARSLLIGGLIDGLFPTDERRSQARWYWQTHRTITPLRPFAVASVLQRVVGGATEANAALRTDKGGVPADIYQFSPGFAASLAANALAACKATGASDDALRACLRRATDPRRYFNDVPPAPPASAAPAAE